MDNQLPGILDRYTPNPCNAEDLDVIAEFIMNGGLQALPRSLLCTALKIATLRAYSSLHPPQHSPNDAHLPGPKSFELDILPRLVTANNRLT